MENILVDLIVFDEISKQQDEVKTDEVIFAKKTDLSTVLAEIFVEEKTRVMISMKRLNEIEKILKVPDCNNKYKNYYFCIWIEAKHEGLLNNVNKSRLTIKTF